MKKLTLILLVFFGCLITLRAQTSPECILPFSLAGTGPTVSIDNRQNGCTNWIVAYQSSGFSAISLLVESTNGATGAGTFASFSGSLTTGINPNTATTQASTVLSGYVGWIRMNLTSATGTGTVRGVLYGRKQTFANAGGSAPTGAAGGDLCGTYPNPCVAKVNGVPYASGAIAHQIPIDGVYKTLVDCPTGGEAYTLSTDTFGCNAIPAGPTSNQNVRSFGAAFDGGGSAIPVSKTVYITAPFTCTITGYNITADTGTISFDVWKVATGTAIPTVANTIISGSSYLALSTGTAVHSTSTAALTTTTVTAFDIVGVKVQTISGATISSLVIPCNAT